MYNNKLKGFNNLPQRSTKKVATIISTVKTLMFNKKKEWGEDIK